MSRSPSEFGILDFCFLNLYSTRVSDFIVVFIDLMKKAIKSEISVDHSYKKIKNLRYEIHLQTH